MPHLNPSMTAQAEIALPSREGIGKIDEAKLRRLIRSRLNVVIPRLIRELKEKWVKIFVSGVWQVAKLFGARGWLAKIVMEKIHDELAVLKK